MEIVTICGLLTEQAPGRWHDKELGWGAKASAYRDEIRTAIAEGWVPVLIELEDDLGLTRGGESIDQPSGVIFIDHHSSSAGKDQPTSLHQVFELLGLDHGSWTRWFDLVAANDRGYIPAMVELGATRDEIVRVRAADRAAQGITAEQETQGEKSLETAQVLAGGRLTVVGLPHDRTAVVSDRLALDPARSGPENLFILGRESVHFFGEGRLVLSMNERFPGGWYGGSLPDRGFWGHRARRCASTWTSSVDPLIGGQPLCSDLSLVPWTPAGLSGR